MPAGTARNGRWYEGIKRGCPDIAKRVTTPANGLPGSEGALLLRSVHTGIPGRPSYRMQQDDFIANVWQRLGGKISVGRTPSVVTRIFMPPIASWENRSGPSFGFRVSLETHAWKVPEERKESWLLRDKKEYMLETYWPGMFVEFQSQSDRGRQYDTAYWRIRGNQRGMDFRGPQITETGWWTLGISVTPDGQVHYYIRKGVEDLTADDYVTSQFPYGYRAERFKTFFYDVCSGDDGRTPSTGWIIDDSDVYVATGGTGVAVSPRSRRR
jgi:hypothetical protein